MSVAGYFGTRRAELRMSKDGIDKVGARFEGAVLTGDKTLEERITTRCCGRIADYETSIAFQDASS